MKGRVFGLDRCGTTRLGILNVDRIEITIDRATVNAQNFSGARFVAFTFGEDELNVAAIKLRERWAIFNE